MTSVKSPNPWLFRKSQCQALFFRPWRARHRNPIGKVNLFRTVSRRGFFQSVGKQLRLLQHKVVIHQRQSLGGHSRDVARAAREVLIGQIEASSSGKGSPRLR